MFWQEPSSQWEVQGSFFPFSRPNLTAEPISSSSGRCFSMKGCYSLTTSFLKFSWLNVCISYVIVRWRLECWFHKFDRGFWKKNCHAVNFLHSLCIWQRLCWAQMTMRRVGERAALPFIPPQIPRLEGRHQNKTTLCRPMFSCETSTGVAVAGCCL